MRQSTSPLTALSEAAGRRWGTVVLIGAGANPALPRADALVLVEGDPAACAHLRAATRGRADVEVIERVVAAESGPATWHHHEWPMADGLADLSRPLRRSYPRSTCSDRRAVEAQAIEELLATLPVEPRADRANLLLLDLPSSADALVAALPATLALRFDWIVSGGLPGPAPGGAHLQAQAGSWSDGPWPWRVWRTDADAGRRAEQLAEAERLLAATASAHRVAQAALEEANDRIAAIEGTEPELAAARVRLAALQRAEAKLALVAEVLLAERLQ